MWVRELHIEAIASVKHRRYCHAQEKENFVIISLGASSDYETYHEIKNASWTYQDDRI